jgi:hypothetical protein
VSAELAWVAFLLMVVGGPLILSIVCPALKGAGPEHDPRQRPVFLLLAVLGALMLSGIWWAFADLDKPEAAATADASTIYFTWLGLTVTLVQALVAGHPRFLRLLANAALMVVAATALGLGIAIGGTFVTPLTAVLFTLTIVVALIADATANLRPLEPGEASATRPRTCHLAPEDA